MQRLENDPANLPAEAARDKAAPRAAASYESPSVESVTTPEDLAREIHYAGTNSGQQQEG